MDFLPLLAQADAFRDTISLDWDDLATLLMALGAVAGVFWVKRTKSETDSHSVTEQIDGDVLTRFLGLTDKVTALELDLAAVKLELADTKQRLAQAMLEMAEMQKIEEYLRASLHEKDQELRAVRKAANAKEKEIRALRARVQHLEDVCKRAGINGEDEEDAQ